ncbi:hypothetical protein N9L47_02265 [Rhodobacteraceae bacterium]|nr:hypothetical protein [Paracoccaceae bacterium]
MLENVIVLCPSEVISIEPPALQQSSEEGFDEGFAPFAEDAVEEMVVCLAAIEAAWAAAEFRRLKTTLGTIVTLADRTGLKDVALAAAHASEVADGHDQVALAAVIARLVRVGEASLATLLEFSYRQI